MWCFGVYRTTIAKQDSRMSVFADDRTGRYPGPQWLWLYHSAGRPRDLHPKPCCLWQDHMVTCSCFFRNLPQKLEIQVWPLFNIRVCVSNRTQNVGTHDIWHTETHHPRGYFQCQTWLDDNLFSHQSFLGVTQTFSAPASRPETSLIQVGL